MPPSTNAPEGQKEAIEGPIESQWRPELVDYMLVIIVLISALFAWSEVSRLDNRLLMLFSAMFSFISVITNLVIIFKVYHADSRTRPWVAKLESITTEIAWAIRAYRQYIEPTIELIKGFGIFQRFYERITGQKLDIKQYVREEENQRPRIKKRIRGVKKVKVWRRDEQVLETRMLKRPQNNY